MSQVFHEDEIAIDLALVRRLVDRALPNCAQRPLRRLPMTGSTNALFRLGDDLVVRLPRQPGGTASIEKEARWLPVLRSRLPIEVPEVVGVFEPDLGYPERWSVVRWIDGETPTVLGPEAPTDPKRAALALDLAELVAALRAIELPADPAEPALHSYRGDPLSLRDADTRTAIEECRRIPGFRLDLDAALAVWIAAMASPDIDRRVEQRWYHGDLLAENLLVRNGRLAAVLDFGGLSVGDPTIDLLAGWGVLDAPAREVFRAALGVDESTWLRGRAWTLSIALITFPYYWHTMPTRCADNLALARSVLADAAR